MDKTSPWQTRFGFTTCTADKIATAIPGKALGLAVVYEPTKAGETVYLVLESRSGSLRDLCAKRLQNAKMPATAALMVSFKLMTPTDASPEAVSTLCREQVILAGELRRELRPAMR